MIEFSYVDFFTVILQFYKIIHCYFYIQFIISTTNLLSKIPGIKLLVGHMQKSDNEKYERIIKKKENLCRNKNDRSILYFYEQQ